jgi:Zn-dependent membrane protease YugP
MPWLIFVLTILTVLFFPGIWVKRTMKKYDQPMDRYKGTGADLARKLLEAQGLSSVQIEVTELGDHYDPVEKAVRLMPERFNGHSLTAVTVAAHEVGHAIQDAQGYRPLVLRTRMVAQAMAAQKLGAIILFASPVIGMITRVPTISGLMLVGGFLSLASATLVHLITLPTEYDASFRRALPILEEGDYLHPVDMPHARRLLKAAALTYVAASLMSLLNIARWWAILRR